MVVVHVGDQHPVELARHLRSRVGAVTVDDPEQPRAQHGIGEHPRAAELDQHGGVADVGDPRRGAQARALSGD